MKTIIYRTIIQIYFFIKKIFSKKFSYDISKIKKLKKSNSYPTNKEFTYNYNSEPEATIVINHFISFKTLKKTIKNLMRINNKFEIIIINDSGINSDKIFKILNSPNHKVVSTYNLGESMGYITGQLISKSTKYIIFTQDDDLAPEDGKWYRDIIKIFKKYKDLSMVSFNGGGYLSVKNNDLNNIGYNLIDFSKIKSRFNTNFFFCTWVKTGPIIIKKKVLEEIGGWQMFAKIGESDHFADMDLAIRVWKFGYKAGLLINNNTLKWKRRYSRDDGLSKKELNILKNRKITWYLNQKKFIKKNKNILKKIELKVIKENKNIKINL